MQDYNYIWQGTMEITLELSCCKYPAASQLPGFYAENREVRKSRTGSWLLCAGLSHFAFSCSQALLKFLGEVHRGVKGFLTDTNGNPISVSPPGALVGNSKYRYNGSKKGSCVDVPD